MKRSIGLLIALSALLLLLLADVSPLMAGEDNREANKAVLLAFFEAEAQRAYDQMDALFVADFVRHSAATTDIQAQEITNLENYKAFLQSTAGAFPDYRNNVQMMVAEGDYVAFYSLFSGTFAQTGNEIEVPIAGIVRFEAGKIVEMWVEWDNVAWGMEMGLIPASGPLPTFEIAYQPPAGANDLEANKAILEAFLEAERTRDYAAMDDLVAANVARHSSAITASPVNNREAFKEWVQATADVYPDFFNTPQIIVAENDLVATYNRFTGTHDATGRAVEFPSVAFVRIEDGKIAELWMEFDNANIMAQLQPTLAEVLPGNTYTTTITQADIEAAGFDPIVGLAGTWEFEFGEVGALDITYSPLSASGTLGIHTEFSVEGNTLSLGEEHGAYSCTVAYSVTRATYIGAWDGTQLIFTSPDDACVERALVLTAHPFVPLPEAEAQ